MRHDPSYVSNWEHFLLIVSSDCWMILPEHQLNGFYHSSEAPSNVPWERPVYEISSRGVLIGRLPRCCDWLAWRRTVLKLSLFGGSAFIAAIRELVAGRAQAGQAAVR